MKLKRRLDPDEWDFRRLVLAHAYVALRYEIMRERLDIDEMTKVLTPEIRHEISNQTTFGEYEKWREEKMSQTPCSKRSKAFWHCWHFQDFPKPWMAFSNSAQALALERYGQPALLYRILTWSQAMKEARLVPPTESAVKYLNALSEKRYVVEIQWSQADDVNLRPLLADLLKMRPDGVRPRKRHTGKGAATPLHKFRQLAAWRLAVKWGLCYKEAQQRISERKEELRPKHSEPLLPDYASAGAWKKAVDAGARLIKPR